MIGNQSLFFCRSLFSFSPWQSSLYRAADPANPQSWNRYAYVLDNPLSNIDPTGLDCVVLHGDAAWSKMRGGFSVQLGDCSGNDPNNEFYFDGTVDPNSVLPTIDGNVLAVVNGELRCSGDSNCNIDSTTVDGGANPQVMSFVSEIDPTVLANIKLPITTATIGNVPGGKEQYCGTRANQAAKNAVLPGLSTPTGRKNTAELAIHYGAEVAEGSTAFKLALRSYTGVAMSTTGKVITGLGAASIAYSSYEALKAAQEEYKACMSE